MSYDLCVIGGAGHVGLPLSVAFAGAGKRVVIYDVNEVALEKISNGQMPFMESGCEGPLRSTLNKTLFASGDITSIGEAKFIIVIVGTPVDEHLNPVHDRLSTFFDSITPYLKDDQILILRSTVYPGTTSRLRRDLKRQLPGIEVGLPVNVFSRAAPWKSCTLFRKLLPARTRMRSHRWEISFAY